LSGVFVRFCAPLHLAQQASVQQRCTTGQGQRVRGSLHPSQQNAGRPGCTSVLQGRGRAVRASHCRANGLTWPLDLGGLLRARARPCWSTRGTVATESAAKACASATGVASRRLSSAVAELNTSNGLAMPHVCGCQPKDTKEGEMRLRPGLSTTHWRKILLRLQAQNASLHAVQPQPL
jgi:hypothetical protein